MQVMKNFLFLLNNPQAYDIINLSELVFIGKMCGFSSIILSVIRKKFAGILSYCKNF